MQINYAAYPSGGIYTSDNWDASYTLVELYLAKSPSDPYISTLVFGDPMDTSNVTVWANENSLLTGFNAYDLDNDGNFVIGEHTPGAANIRWGFLNTNSNVYSGYNDISDNANTAFVDDTTLHDPDLLNHGAVWAPMVNCSYTDFWLSCRYVVLDKNSAGGSPTVTTYYESSLSADLLANGVTYYDNPTRIQQIILGVTFTVFSNGGSDNTQMGTPTPLWPMIELYTPSGVYFGSPFVYSYSTEFTGYEYPSLYLGGDTSRDIYPWYDNDDGITFGFDESSRKQTTRRAVYMAGAWQGSGNSSWTIGNVNPVAIPYTSVENQPTGYILPYPVAAPVVGAFKYSSGSNYFPIYTKSDIYNMIASLGCWFTFDDTLPMRFIEKTTDIDTLTMEQVGKIHLGKIYPDGHTDGTYTTGMDTLNEIQATMATMFEIDFTPIDPSQPYDPPTPPATDDEITTATHNSETSLPALDGIRTISGDAFSTFYDLSLYHVRELGNLLSQMPQSFWDALGTATDPKQANLLDYIVSLKWYPVLMHDSTDAAVTSLQFGFGGNAAVTLTSAGTSYRMANINRIFDMGSIDISYRNQARSFLDVEPYTSVSLYLPYIGTTPLQCNDVLGHTISCTYVVDFTTGMCTALIANDVDTLYIGTGKIGVDISVSGNDIITQSEKMASAYMGTAVRSTNAALSIGASIASENIAGTISSMAAGVADIATSSLAIANAKRGIPETVGTASGFGGSYTHQSPYIMIKRPAVSIPGAYGHDIGYVCNRTYAIGSLTGFSVCQNPDLTGISATSAEIDMIRSILCTGFYA